MWLEGGQYELGASAPLASHWVEVAVWELLDLLSDALAVLGVKSAVKLIHDVEWSCLNLLDCKDQASGYDSLLSSREMTKRKWLGGELGLPDLLVFFGADHLFLETWAVLKALLTGEAHQHPYPFVEAVTNSELLTLVDLWKLRWLTLLRHICLLELHELQLCWAIFHDALEDWRKVSAQELEVVLDWFGLLLFERVQQLRDLVLSLLLLREFRIELFVFQFVFLVVFNAVFVLPWEGLQLLILLTY